MQSSLKPEEDYLDEDKPYRQLVKKQNFCVISMLTPNSFPETKREQYKDQKILGIKVRGVTETYEEARTRAEQLQKQDKHHNIFVGEIGKWLPFNVDISTMETEDDPVYREQALNQYMKAYKDSLKEEEIEEKERKEQTLRANNAKVVTGMTDAPSFTGIGCPEITPPGVVPQSMNTQNGLNQQEASQNQEQQQQQQNQEQQQQQHQNQEQNQEQQEVLKKDLSVEEQISLTQKEKSKINNELEDSKKNLSELENKLLAINQMYADLKK